MSWKSLLDGPPPANKSVLVWIPISESICQVTFREDCEDGFEFWKISDGPLKGQLPSHWMYLPTPVEGRFLGIAFWLAFRLQTIKDFFTNKKRISPPVCERVNIRTL